jgi:hypothetical protein
MGLHKWRKVKSTKTTVMSLMQDIIRAEGKILLPINSEEIICRKFGVNRDTLWCGFDIYDYVCVRLGCNCCDPRVDIKRHKLIENRNYVVRKEIMNGNKDRLAEKIHMGCKNGS